MADTRVELASNQDYRQTETLKFDYKKGKFYTRNYQYIESGSEQLNHGTYSFDAQTNTLTIDAIDWTTTAEIALDLSGDFTGGNGLNLIVRYSCNFYSHSRTREAVAVYFHGGSLNITSALYESLNVGTRSVDDRIIDKAYGIKCTGSLTVNNGALKSLTEFGRENYGIYAEGNISLYNAWVTSNVYGWPVDGDLSYGIYSALSDIILCNSYLEALGRTAAVYGKIRLKTNHGSDSYRWWYIHGAIPPYDVHVINYGAKEGTVLKEGVVQDTSDKNYLNFLPTRTCCTGRCPSLDDSVYLYHEHTEGSGVPIFIMPVHFAPEDIGEGNKYITASSWAAELILKAEAFEDIWNYLDIYIYMKSDIIHPVPQSGYHDSFAQCVERMERILLQLGKDADLPNARMIYFGNCDNAGQVGGHAYGGRGALFSWGQNPQTKTDWEPSPRYWVLHEFIGHAFAGFADEYRLAPYWDDKPHVEASNLYISPEKPKQQDVPWKDFIGFKEKSQKQIDIYGYDNYNAWRPCEDDCMNGNPNMYVSMYHKWVVYKRVMEIAKINKTLDDFCKFKHIMLKPFHVAYCAHVKNNGWLDYVRDGQTAGTTGQSRRLEAVRIRLEDCTIPGARIKYRVHVKNNGWLPYVYDNEIAGTTGESRRAEAIQIQLIGLDDYSVEYRVHMQSKGWSSWVCDGAVTGTTGESRRIEAVEIRIKKKS